MKAFFFRNLQYILIIFPFSKLSFDFCKKTSIQVEKGTFEIILIDTHSTANLPPLPIFKEVKFFFHQNPWFFFKEPRFRALCEFLLFQSQSTANLL